MRSLIFLGMLMASSVQGANIGACKFDDARLQFSGSAREQAGCLLRHVSKWGRMDAEPARLPAALLELIDEPVGALKTELTHYLIEKHIREEQIGGSLSGALSHAQDGVETAPAARYFVIHDTSFPVLGKAGFPRNGAAQLNRLAPYAGPEAVAHVFVSRTGETLLGHDFNVPWRATKLENLVLGEPAKGLFLHVELLQPRRRDASRRTRNDAIAPTPGFTAVQYEKLALLYAAASARADVWLIPAFHAALDQGACDALEITCDFHDDPQNFELKRFADAIARLRKALRQ